MSESTRHILLYLRPQSFRLTVFRQLTRHIPRKQRPFISPRRNGWDIKGLCSQGAHPFTARVSSTDSEEQKEMLAVESRVSRQFSHSSANNNMPQTPNDGASPLEINTAFQSTQANFTKFVNFCFVWRSSNIL